MEYELRGNGEENRAQARIVAADGAIRTEIDKDMLDVTPNVIEVEGEVVNAETGEIVEGANE